MACSHTNTSFDPVTSSVICRDCGKVIAKVKPKAGNKIMIPGRKPRK